MNRAGDSLRRGWLRLYDALRSVTLVVPVALLIGSVCAFFLWSLTQVTLLRLDHPWLLFLLPLAGFGVGWLYLHYGQSADGGNNLILDQIHAAEGRVPRRMAPLVLLGTLVSHLFGASVGREGTAVQMGGSIASGVGGLMRVSPERMRILLLAGVASGFGAVFGTPLAGTIFALEVLTVGRIHHEALLPCLIGAVVGDWTCHAWGVGHARYAIQFLGSTGGAPGLFHLDFWLWLKVAVAGMGFGLASLLFAKLVHTVGDFMKARVAYAPLRPLCGGLLTILLVWIVSHRDYLGLGEISHDPGAITFATFFTSAEAHPWSWAWKLIFTVAAVGTGFKGGEVTPLFFIGAALGYTLAGLLGVPADLLAGLGLVAVFAGATKTPMACTLMGIELFGSTHALYFATACFLAYQCSGHTGIYRAQRRAE